MATGGVSSCPLCGAVVEGGDQLQLHYLTGCSAYDHGADELGVASSSQVRDLPPAIQASSTMPTSSVSASNNRCLVQFMWQPLTQMSYAKVTLLTSFESGSVDLSIDPEGGHYSSEKVSVPSGTYEGQMVVGDSFIHPVKQFTVDSSSGGIVVLEFDIGKGEGMGSGAGGNDIVMNQNPSYDQSYAYGEDLGRRGGEGGHVSYQDRDAPYRRKTGTAAEGDVLGTFGYHDQFQGLQPRAATGPTNDLSGSRSPLSSRPATSAALSDTYQRKLSSEEFDPATLKSKETYTSDSSATALSGPKVVSGPIAGAASTVEEAQTDKGAYGINISSASTIGGLTSSGYAVNQLEGVGDKDGRGRSGSQSTKKKMVAESGGREEGRLEGVGGEDEEESVRMKPGYDREREDGFSVNSIHNRRSLEDTVRDYEQQLEELRDQLAKVTEEKDTLLQDRERVSAQWEGKVRRLKMKLKQQKGEGEGEAPQEDSHLEEMEEMQSRLDTQSSQIASLTAKLEEKDKELVFNERQLKEQKNMNAALENQLTEYMDALDHQNKSVQRSVATRQSSSAELAQAERESAQMAEFIRKQQLEYQEALQSLQKKAGLMDDLQQENLKIHQLNLTLTGELEDYRNQTKTLLADLHHKDEKIAKLQQSGSQFGKSDRSQLELETMKQKCDAWREEVEKLSPLRDEVARLHQESVRLHQELARVTEDNAGLGKQLQELSSGRGKVGELEQKANDYDQLMERVTELQQVRVQLENELTPLRAERATILSENTTLREGSQVEKYVQLKNSYAALSDQCVQLQKSLTEESAINKKMELANRELQQQLEQTTDEKSLQAIRDRMERYKHEREQLRMNVAQLQNELQAHRAEQQENQETIAGLQLALKDSSQQAHHEQAEIWGKQVDSIAQKLEESDKRMRRYREERNTANIMIKSLHEQIGTLQNTVQQLQNSRAYDSYTSEQFDTTSMVSRLQDNTSLRRDLSASPEEQAEPYSPDAYSDPHPGSGMRRPARQMSSGRCTPSGGNHKHRNSLNTSGIVSADVTMKDGITRNVPIERPQYKLNPKQKPAVIVKRKGGNYETGTLVFVGVLEGREMAGVILDFPSGTNDGQFKDGKYYFRCTTSYGVYCPLSNIYVEANSATV